MLLALIALPWFLAALLAFALARAARTGDAQGAPQHSERD